ncbi:hypothetical protein SKAU_G00082230 [Synaphobranchus kaupii]|uniref:Uncharacterized protein n=1 Tax=Synaphobranchus kaupii TaxID=118154 RepID=A0A9Q1FV13_SYNKA|nr:hypothetical protein SKAU_G00082230 [Synaphobranchus kaupii]
MKRLQASDHSFTFKNREDDNYGPFLVSVNGLAGTEKDRTYWELLVQSADGAMIWSDVEGISSKDEERGWDASSSILSAILLIALEWLVKGAGSAAIQ